MDVAGFFAGFGILVGLIAATAIASYCILQSTVRAKRTRTALLLGSSAAYHVAVYFALSGPQAMMLGPIFVLFHLGFVFRHLSSVYYHHLHREAPSFGYYVPMLVCGPRQHYGAGSYEELGGERFGKQLVRQWGRHLGYGLAVAAIGLTMLVLAIRWQGVPFRLTLFRGAWFVLGLEILALLGNLQNLFWSFSGHHQHFFGRFAWFRSFHIGQWWQNWNVFAIKGFREFSKLLGLRRHYFLNTMIVFVVSGLLHQGVVFYCIRQISFGALLTFVTHGFLVWLFGRLHHARRRIPAPARWVLFNPLTSAVVTISTGQFFVMDFYGEFVLRF